jgi:hypothetical protein
MNNLDREKWDIVAGGGPTGMVCDSPAPTHVKAGNIDVTTSSQFCELANGGTKGTKTDVTVTQVSLGLTGLIKWAADAEIKGVQVTVKTEIETCKPNGECSTKTTETTTGQKSSDLGDGSDFESFAGGDFGGGGDGAGCVQITSRLPCGTLAGDIVVGSQMHLSDQASLKAGVGIVSFSKRKKAPGYRLTTVSGVTLVCSNTAPIPTPDGIVLAPNLAGKMVAVRRDEGGASHSGWEAVKSVEPVGEIDIQHITVGDKCFWAGEKPNSYILHHNMKNADNSYGGDGGANTISWDDWA